MKMYKSLLTAIIIIMVMGIAKTVTAQHETRVTLESAETENFTKSIIEKTEAVLLAINVFQKSGQLSFPEDTGVDDLIAILKETPLSSSRDTLHSQLIRLSNDKYEVRKLFLQVGDIEYESQELVLVFDTQANLVESHIADQLQNFERVLNRSIEADEQETHLVEQVLQQFASAFNTKDAAILAELLHPEALIISGSIMDAGVMYNRTNTEDYVSRLAQNTFTTSGEVDVQFEQIQVFRNPMFRNVFAVSLYQHWRTPTYSDEGYMALVVDLREENQPIIHTRFWQPEKFEVGRFAEIDMEPLPLVWHSVHYNFTETLTKGQGLIRIQIRSENEDVLSTEILESWITDGIVEINGLRLLHDDIQIETNNEISIPFEFDNHSRAYLQSEIRAYDTSFLSAASLKMTFLNKYEHTLTLEVTEEELLHVYESGLEHLGELIVTSDHAQAELRIINQMESTVVYDDYFRSDFIYKQLSPGSYLASMEMEDYESKEQVFEITDRDFITIHISLEEIILPEPELIVVEESEELEKGFYEKNRLLIWSSLVATTVTTAAIMLLSSSDGSATIQLPPPPDRP